MLNITKKCKEVWFNREKYPRIRSNENLFTPEEIIAINKRLHWLDFDSNIKEKVMYVAHDFYGPPACPITKEEILTKKPLYRTYTDKHLQNRCFFLFSKIKEKIIPPFYTNYCFEDVELLFRQTPPNAAVRCPLFINHCWVALTKKDIDISKIESNEEALHLHLKNYTQIPSCNITGKKLPFCIASSTYRKYSSKEASHVANGLKNKNKKISRETIQRRTDTNLKKYGVTSPLALASTYNKGLATRQKNAAAKREKKEYLKSLDKRLPKEKRLDTICQKYGVSSLKEYRTKYPLCEEKKICAQKKRQQTLLNKYSTTNNRLIPEINEKIKNTNIAKYGVSCYMNLPEIKKKNIEKTRKNTYLNFSRFAKECTPLFTLEEWLAGYDKKLPWKKTYTGEVFYCKYYGYPPVGRFTSSSLESTIHKMLDTLNIKYIKHDREIIKPQEIDIYLPDFKLGIECNGEYFHSIRTLKPTYHIKKTEFCDSVGIRLLHFFGKDILTKPNIVFNIIKTHTIGNNIRVQGRKCFVKIIDSVTAQKFYEKYHLDGFCRAKKHYGLFYKNRLVSAASIGRHRFTKHTNAYEIVRYAVMRNVYIIGGFAKLLQQVKKDFKNCTLHTYADYNLFTGKVYEKAEFTFLKNTVPDYYYYNNKQYVSRYQAQKHKLKNLLQEKFDPLKTEEQNMLDAGYNKVYGCGSKHFILNI